MKATKRSLSIALVFLMLFAAALPGACAGQTKTYTELKPTEALTINETLKLEKNDTPVPTVTYTFEVTGGPTLMEGESLGGAVGNPFFSTDTVVFSQSDAGDVTVVGAGDYSRQITKQVVMDFTGVTFTEPGIYRWQITKTRTAAAADGEALPSNNKQVTYVYVTVTDDTEDTVGSELKLKAASYIYTTSAVLPPETGPAEGGARNFVLSGDKASPRTGPKKIDSIEDLYPTRVRDLSFGKKVSGNQGSKDKYFKFTLTLEGLEQGVAYPVSGQDTDPQKTDATVYNAAAMKAANNRQAVVADGNGTVQQDFYLQHGDYITVENLPVGAHYTLTEVNEGYTKTNGTDDKVTEVLGKDYAAQYQAAMDDLQAKITTLNQKTTDKQTEYETLNNQKTTAEGELNALNTDIQDKASAIQNENLAGSISGLQTEMDTLNTQIGNKDTAIEAKMKDIYGDGGSVEGALNELNALLGTTPGADVYNQALAARKAAQDDVLAKQNALNEAQREVDKQTRLVSEAQAAYDAAVADVAAKQEAVTRATDAQTAAQSAYNQAVTDYNQAEQAYIHAQAAEQTTPGTYTQQQLDALLADMNTALQNKTDAQAALTAANTALTAAQDALGDDTKGAIKAKNDAEAALTAAQDALGDNTKGAVKAKNDAQTALNAANDTLAEKQQALVVAANTFNQNTQIADKMAELNGLYADLEGLNNEKLALQNQLGIKNDEKALKQQELQDDLNELQDLNDQKAAKQAEIDEMEEALEGINREIADLDTEIDALQAELTKLTTRKTALANRVFSDAQDGYIKDDDVFTGFTNNWENVVPTGILSQLGAPVALILASLALMVLLTLGRKKQARG